MRRLRSRPSSSSRRRASTLLEKRPQWGDAPAASAGPRAGRSTAGRPSGSSRCCSAATGRRRRQRARRRVGRGQPAVRRRSWSRCWSTRACIQRRRATGCPTGDLASRGRPADDPGAARGPPRRPLARGAGGHGAGLGHRPVVRRAGDRGARARQRSGRPCRPTCGALDRKQFVAPGRRRRERGRGLPLPQPHDQGRDLRRRCSSGRARSSHERFVAWAERVNRRARPRAGVRGDPRLPPRAGVPLPDASSGRSTPRAARSPSARRDEARRTPAGARWPAATSRRRVSLLKRAAAALLPDDSVGRLDILFDLGESAHPARRARRGAGRSSRRARGSPSELGDERLKARMVINELMLDQFTGSGSARAADRASASEVIDVLERYEDDFALARAWNEVVFRELTRGQYAAATVSADMLVATTRGAPADERLAGQVAPAARVPHGPRRDARVGGDPGLRRAPRRPSAATGRPRRSCSAALAQLKAMDGEFDEARALCQRVRRSSSSSGPRIDANSTSIEASRVEILAGDLEAAEAMLRRDDEALEAIDEQYFRSTIAGILANVLALRGGLDEAGRLRGAWPKSSRTRTTSGRRSRGAPRARRCSRTGAAAEEAVAMAQERGRPGGRQRGHRDARRRAHGAGPGSRHRGPPGIGRASLAGGPGTLRA